MDGMEVPRVRADGLTPNIYGGIWA